jgi:glycine/D-amino acid oxidase-like deaminating enzyme
VTLQLESKTIAHRPIPKDGLPLVGRAERIDGLYVAVTHSGITLAPALGRFVADEIMTQRRHLLLAPFDLARLAAGFSITP